MSTFNPQVMIKILKRPGDVQLMIKSRNIYLMFIYMDKSYVCITPSVAGMVEANSGSCRAIGREMSFTPILATFNDYTS